MSTAPFTWADCPPVDGAALREARLRKGLTRRALALTARVTQHRVINLESVVGSRWRTEELRVLAAVLNVAPDRLCAPGPRR